MPSKIRFERPYQARKKINKGTAAFRLMRLMRLLGPVLADAFLLAPHKHVQRMPSMDGGNCPNLSVSIYK
jgi:hypothetical protein